MTREALQQLERVVWPAQSGRHAWVILDAARDSRIFPLLLECHLEYSCLYSGTLPPLLSMAAPYLVRLEYDYRDTRRFIQGGWGNSWGVFLHCDEGMKTLRRHLRELLVVRDAAGRHLLFRYYDPRVLRMYLPTCTGSELRMVFGPVQSFWLEDESEHVLITFHLVDGRLARKEVELDAHHSG